jgi:hypothetical protein
MKKFAFWAVLAAVVIVPLAAWASFSWGVVTLTPEQLTLLKAKPDKEITIELNAGQIEIVHAKFHDFTGKSLVCKFVHVYEGSKILVTFEHGKLVSVPVEQKIKQAN